MWEDSPVATLLTDKSEWSSLPSRACLERLKAVLAAHASPRAGEPWPESHNKTPAEFLQFLQTLVPPQHTTLVEDIQVLLLPQWFTSLDDMSYSRYCLELNVEPTHVDPTANPIPKTYWTCSQCTLTNHFATSACCSACDAPSPVQEQSSSSSSSFDSTWKCSNCTYVNARSELSCGMCQLGPSGERQVPRHHWVCAGEEGGCTYFNANANFYCQVCHRARPNLKSTRF